MTLVTISGLYGYMEVSWDADMENCEIEVSNFFDWEVELIVQAGGHIGKPVTGYVVKILRSEDPIIFPSFDTAFQLSEETELSFKDDVTFGFDSDGGLGELS